MINPVIKGILCYCLWTLCSLTQAATQTIKVAIMPVFSSSPVFIADDYQYFQNNGLNVEYVLMGSAQNVAVAVATGDADVGVTGITAGFLNLAGKGGLKIIAGQYMEKQGVDGSAYLVCNKAFERGLTSIDKLPGHRLGMTTVGSTFHRWYGGLAEKLNTSMTTFELVSLQSVSGMISALAGCHIDAMIALPQVADKLVNEKKAHIIARVSDISPGQVGIAFTSTNALKNKPEQIKSFLKAYRAATGLYHSLLIKQQPPFSAASKKLLNQINQRLKPSISEAQLENSILYIPEKAMPEVQDIQKTLSWFQQQKLVSSSVTLKKVLQLELLEQINRDAARSKD